MQRAGLLVPLLFLSTARRTDGNGTLRSNAVAIEFVAGERVDTSSELERMLRVMERLRR